MEPTRGPLDQPLVWDRPPSGPHQAPRPRVRSSAPGPRWSRARLWVATLADLGAVLLSLAAVWGIAAVLGAAPVEAIGGLTLDSSGFGIGPDITVPEIRGRMLRLCEAAGCVPEGVAR